MKSLRSSGMSTAARTASKSLLDIRSSVLRTFGDIEWLRILAHGWDGAGQCTRDEEPEFAQRNAEAVDDDWADDQKPDDDVHDFDQIHSVLSGLAVDFELVEKLDADVEVECGTDADGAEEADEEGLPLLLDLVY